MLAYRKGSNFVAIYAPMIYTAPYVMLLMRAASITRAWSNPLPLAQVMDAARIKSIMHRAV
jgi:hypothetical protein